jgi:alpha-beta hydrolase superfamily lysophospholipase
VTAQRFIFRNPAFELQARYRLGLAATGAADLGEVLALARTIDDDNDDTWFDAWSAMASRVEGVARGFLRGGHETSAREAFLRVSSYFRSAEVFLAADDPRRIETWQRGTDAFKEMAALSEGLVVPVEIPFEGTALHGYWCRADASGARRPVLLVQSGLDGSPEDLYPTIVSTALTRGYNCLAFEGPGQGGVIRIQGIPFRPHWETVVTPVIDFTLALPEVDADRVALIGYSMGGYLAPRAAAHDHRLRVCVANAGVFDVFAGVASTFSSELRRLLQEDAEAGGEATAAQIDEIVSRQMEVNPSTRQFIGQMLWTFAVDSPSRLFRELRKYTMRDCIDRIECETLVVNSSDDKVAGSHEQAKQFYAALTCPKAYLELTGAEGAEKHCQAGAPMIANERILNWLDDRLQGRVATRLS